MNELSQVGALTMPRLEGILWMLAAAGLLVALSATPALAQTRVPLIDEDEVDATELFDSLDTSKSKSKPVSMSGSFEFDRRSGLTLNGQRVYLTPMTLVVPSLAKGRQYTEQDLNGRRASVLVRRSRESQGAFAGAGELVPGQRGQSRRR